MNGTHAARLPKGLPFVLRWSGMKLGLLFLVVAATMEIGLGVQTAPGELADVYGSWWVHAVFAAPLLAVWLILARQRAILGLSPAGLWVAIRVWPRPLAVRLDWAEVALIRDARVQWHRGVAIELTAAARDRLLAELGRPAKAAFNESRRAYGADLSASLTLADGSVRRVMTALLAYAPPEVPWVLTVPPKSGRVTRWVGRIVVAVIWVSLFLFVVPGWLVRGFNMTDVVATLIEFLCGVVGAASLAWVFTAYEAAVSRVLHGSGERHTSAGFANK